MRISGTTKVFGVLGWPVAHSLSPVFQSIAMEKAGEDAVYVPFPCPPERVAEAARGLHAAGVAGLNLTVPHKEAALALAESADSDAREIGAANTWIRTDTGWHAANTDWIGLVRAIRRWDRAGGWDALLFGAGGAARAAAKALAELGARTVWITNRTLTRAEQLVEDAARLWPQTHWSVVPWEAGAVERAAETARWVINATALGLSGEAFPFAVPGEGFAMDLVYRPDGRTPFVEAAERAGRRATDGLWMLVEQGLVSLQRWTGHAVSADEVIAEMQALLGRSGI
ncbi:MAG: shikimate dehydrogenase [Zetaproteobacteria bacterium]|nr:MAG: shikimate dehydrogenase [Zetaproteobacteria bacterium]